MLGRLSTRLSPHDLSYIPPVYEIDTVTGTTALPRPSTLPPPTPASPARASSSDEEEEDEEDEEAEAVEKDRKRFAESLMKGLDHLTNARIELQHLVAVTDPPTTGVVVERAERVPFTEEESMNTCALARLKRKRTLNQVYDLISTRCNNLQEQANGFNSHLARLKRLQAERAHRLVPLDRVLGNPESADWLGASPLDLSTERIGLDVSETMEDVLLIRDDPRQAASLERADDAGVGLRAVLSRLGRPAGSAANLYRLSTSSSSATTEDDELCERVFFSAWSRGVWAALTKQLNSDSFERSLEIPLRGAPEYSLRLERVELRERPERREARERLPLDGVCVAALAVLYREGGCELAALTSTVERLLARGESRDALNRVPWTRLVQETREETTLLGFWHPKHGAAVDAGGVAWTTPAESPAGGSSSARRGGAALAARASLAEVLFRAARELLQDLDFEISDGEESLLADCERAGPAGFRCAWAHARLLVEVEATRVAVRTEIRGVPVPAVIDVSRDPVFGVKREIHRILARTRRELGGDA